MTCQQDSSTLPDRRTNLELVEQVIGVKIRAIVKSNGNLAIVHTVVDTGAAEEHVAELRSFDIGSVSP